MELFFANNRKKINDDKIKLANKHSDDEMKTLSQLALVKRRKSSDDNCE